MSDEERYQMTDFDEYIRAGEPEKRQRAENWRTAIGLQDVDGLKTSDYLKETARRNIEGEITIDEARQLVKTYYQTKTMREPDDDGKEEADRVSSNIAKILGEPSFAFSVVGITSIHRRLFEGVFKFASQIREYDITKKEWVLRGDTVNYMYAADLRRALEYDLEQERAFSYKGLPLDEVVTHIAKFISGIWQIHAFGEGNTRTTAIFCIKYLHTLGFEVDNSLFADKSWYFRNALVRANYHNYKKGVDYEPIFLIRFFRNLLMGEHNELCNRYMLINPPVEWQKKVEKMKADMATEQAPNKHRTSTEQAGDILLPNNENVMQLLLAIGEKSLSMKELLLAVGLKHRATFMENYLTPAIADGFVRMLYPQSPKSPRQKYLLTVKGLAVYNENIKRNEI